MSAWLWLILAVVCMVVEAITLGLTSIWFAIGALIAYVLASFDFTWQVQVATFLLTSLILLYYTGPIARRYLKIGSTPTNVQALIGEVAVVVEKIERGKKGQVQVKGQIWFARTKDLQEADVDEEVIIDQIEGNTLVVRRI
jgi:membrane protein implicated in regulation of membrane protease activity